MINVNNIIFMDFYEGVFHDLAYFSRQRIFLSHVFVANTINSVPASDFFRYVLIFFVVSLQIGVRTICAQAS